MRKEEEIMSTKSIGFIGLGLIGGSIAKALRRVHPEYRLIAYNRSKSSLVAAMSDGTLNQATDVIDASFSDCDFYFFMYAGIGQYSMSSTVKNTGSGNLHHYRCWQCQIKHS
jgi:lactate dehydrogenase-like 2-hydroxyacid dehydrogenase